MNIRKRTAADGSRNLASGNGRILCAGNMNASYIAFGVVTTADARLRLYRPSLLTLH